MRREFRIRYFLEHKVLPVAFYGDGIHLRDSLLHSSTNTMYQFYEHAEETEYEYQCPYNESDFDVAIRTYIRGDNASIIIRVGMPEPEYPLLCRAVYLCYGADDSNAFYVTSELNENGGYYICGWSNRGIHINFGETATDPSDEMDLAAEIFGRMIANDGFTKLEGLRRCQG